MCALYSHPPCYLYTPKFKYESGIDICNWRHKFQLSNMSINTLEHSNVIKSSNHDDDNSTLHKVLIWNSYLNLLLVENILNAYIATNLNKHSKNIFLHVQEFRKYHTLEASEQSCHGSKQYYLLYLHFNESPCRIISLILYNCILVISSL